MKASRFSFYLFMLLLSGMTILSCSKDDPVEPDGGTEEPGIEEPEEPAGDEEIAVLSENAFVLTEDILNYVENDVVTDHNIKLSNAIPESELPKVGQVIVCGVDSEKFPYGFMGKVEQVVSSGGSYEIHTVPASLTEAFDELSINQELEFEVESDDSDSRALSWGMEKYSDADGFEGTNYIIKELPLVNDDVSVSLSGNSGFAVKGNLVIEHYKSTPLYVSFTAGFKRFFNVGISVEGEASGRIFNGTLASLSFSKMPVKIFAEKNTKLGESRAVQVIPVILFILQPRIDINVFGELEGSFEVSGGFGAEAAIQAGGLYRGGEGFKVGAHVLPNPKFNLDFNGLSLDGKYKMGLEAAFIIQPLFFKKPLMQLSADIGPSIESSMKGIGSPNFYEQNQETTIALNFLDSRGQAIIDFRELFGSKEDDEDLVKECALTFPLLSHEYSLFPRFDDLKAQRTAMDKTQAVITSNVVNDLIVPVEVDYQLYNKDEVKLPIENNWTFYYRAEDMVNPFMKMISGLATDETYYIRPKLNMPIFGEIEASPSVEIEPEISVTTEHYLSQGESLTLLGSFDPALQADCNITEYGICYDTSGNPTLYGTHNAASGNDEGLFQTTIIAEDDVTYYYRAYLIADGQIYYGEVKEAKKEKNDSLIGEWKLVGYSEVGDLSGGHGWKYGDFSIRADGTFTTSIIPWLPPMTGRWYRVDSNKFVIYYDFEGETLGIGFIIENVTETTLRLYSETAENEGGEEQDFFGVHLDYVKQ